MTLYSTYGVNRFCLVDGVLSRDDDERLDEEMNALVQCVASGVVRGLLDQVRDRADPDDDTICAEQWHSAVEGWELGAVADDDQGQLLEWVGWFVRDNEADVLLLAQRIAREPRRVIWYGNTGMGAYRVGYLLGMEGAGQGLGLSDYWQAGPGQDVTVRLSAWLSRQEERYPFEDAWVDTSEEPCLLHLGW